MSHRMTVLADDMMPGVEACLAQWRDAQGQAPQFRLLRSDGRDLNAEYVQQAQLLLVRSITRVDAALLAQAPALRFVGSATIGQDHLDLDALAARAVAWSTAPGCNAQAVAEWVLATVLRQAARTPAMTLTQLRAKRVGVIGLGHVGQRVAALLSALGLQIYGCDPLLSAAERATRSVAGWQAIDALLASADIVCVHTPLTRSGPAPTWQMLNAQRLAQLQPGAWLINAGRGDVLDAPAFIEAQRADAQRVALLDVLPNEPLPAPELVAHCQQVSPHIAGHSLEGKWRGTWQICANAAAHFGYQQVGELADIIPLQAPPALTWPTAADPQAVAPYAELMAAVVDCAGDDARLRSALTEQPGQAAAFDALRKHYATRREIAAHRLSGVPNDSSAQQLLTALGFSC